MSQFRTNGPPVLPEGVSLNYGSPSGFVRTTQPTVITSPTRMIPGTQFGAGPTSAPARVFTRPAMISDPTIVQSAPSQFVRQAPSSAVLTAAGVTSLTPNMTRGNVTSTTQTLKKIESIPKEILLTMFEADGVTGTEKVPFEELIYPDTQRTFFSQDLALNQKDIDVYFQEARDFFKGRFGLDPEDFTQTDNKWTLRNHRFYPYRFKDTIDYHAHYPLEDGGARRYPITDGGYILVVGDPGFVAFGKYGGENGRLIKPRNVIMYGFMKIDYPNGPRVYHYQSDIPYMSCLENVYHPQFIVYNTSKGNLGPEAFGYGITGSGTFQETDGTFRVGGRNVVSFPGYYTEL